MSEINDKFIYDGMVLEVVSLSNGAHGGLVWVAFPPKVNTLTREVHAYLADEFNILVDKSIIKKTADE